jgi:multidrug efflux system membrane fusion protein
MFMFTRLLTITLCFVSLLAEIGRGEPPVVPVSQPLQRQVTDYQDYTGRTEAAATVTIKPRVTGYLTRVAFKDGSEVKQGDLLFEIDPRPYQAALDQAMSEVALHEATLKLAKSVLDRDMELGKRAPGSVSQQQFDQDKAAVDQATAKLRGAHAAAESAKLNLEFTRVMSPIAGRIGRRFFDAGNLVKADETELTTVLSQEPMYAYFDMDEATMLRIRRGVNDGKIKPSGETPIFMRLADETGFPLKGTVDFVNNQVNPTTGTVTVRAVFANPLPAQGERLLMPGMFVRLRLPIGQPHEALLVPESALISDRDQGLKNVYVIDADNKVQRRQVKIGAAQPDGLRVIVEGLKPEDWVAVGALKELRPGMSVKPEKDQKPKPSDK